MTWRSKTAVSLGIVATTALSLIGASWASARAAATYPRSQSLITSGSQWGNIAGTNPYTSNHVVGLVGLAEETLLRYDPLKDRYINWLARSAEFTGAKTFVVAVRPGVYWSNGKRFTGRDVAFNFRLGRFDTAPWHNLYLNLRSIKVTGNVVTFRFKTTPDYAQWQTLLCNLPMINPGQAATIRDAESLLTFSPADPIGTGPYELALAGFDPTTQVVWKKKANWWAARQHLSPSPAPKYVIDLVNTDSTNALSGLLTGIEDLNNNYLPGIQDLVKSGKARTFYPKAPYDLAADTAWLAPNVTHKPLNDKAFRRALATSINRKEIASADYGNLVEPANATGLLNVWSKWINKSQLKSLGFKYSTANARKILVGAGYKLGDDGYFNNPDGSKIDLSIIVPENVTVWENAEQMIVNSAKAAGIRITINVVDESTWTTDRQTGQFDLAIESPYQLSDNPWTYFDGLFHLPIVTTGAGQTFANTSRYRNKTAWRLVQKLDHTPLPNLSARKSIMSRLEKIVLTDIPSIPLWYDGVWAQTQSKYWTNWPSSTSRRRYYPCMGNGYLQLTGIDMITHLKPVKSQPAASTATKKS